MNISSGKISKRLEYRFASELSLVAGIIILGAAVLSLKHMTFFPDMGWMAGPYLHGHVDITSIVGITSGIMVIIYAIMIYAQPSHIRKWGMLIWFFSSLSFFGIGGFIIGGILGIIGGFLAVTKGITFFGSRPRFFKK
ncbi:MAG: hypothetical protein WCC52_04035 [Nitrosotalea sp.]